MMHYTSSEALISASRRAALKDVELECMRRVASLRKCAQATENVIVELIDLAAWARGVK